MVRSMKVLDGQFDNYETVVGGQLRKSNAPCLLKNLLNTSIGQSTHDQAPAGDLDYFPCHISRPSFLADFDSVYPRR